MKQCPFCAEEIQDAAIVCKHCGRDLNVTTAQASAPIAVTTPPKKSKTGAGIGCLSIIAIGIVGCFFIIKPDTSPEGLKRKAEDDARAAVTTLCERAVKERLKAPATAEFPHHTIRVVTGTDKYIITSYVDAQNGFGAKLRNQFLCGVEGKGEAVSGYKVTTLTMD